MATKKQINNLKYIFEPNGVAVVGASATSTKVGAVVLKNLIDGRYEHPVYPVNPKYDELMGVRCYKTLIEIKGHVDCAVIATPAITVPKLLEQCGKKGIRGVIILSGGFGEVGNKELEGQVKQIAAKYSMAVIGPNCLGILNPYSRVDSIFLPMHKLARPDEGGIAFVTQSGAAGSCIVDLVATYRVGISKFISYGNAAVLDESDMLEFLEKDKKTKQILLYVEGVRDGRKFLNVLKRVNKKKPVIVLKAGKSESASKAAFSHTGNVAGSYLAYLSAFRQAKVICAEKLEELFEFVRIFGQPMPKGKRVGVITNGGGLGVLTADAIVENALELPEFSVETKKQLRAILPEYANINNPLDIIADADCETYDKTIDILMKDPMIDSIVVIVLFQAPAVDDRIINILTDYINQKTKPIVVIAVGGDYTRNYRKTLEGYGVPAYSSPSAAIKALNKLVEYAHWKIKNKW